MYLEKSKQFIILNIGTSFREHLIGSSIFVEPDRRIQGRSDMLTCSLELPTTPYDYQFCRGQRIEF